jgi:signal transduction histidine kinase
VVHGSARSVRARTTLLATVVSGTASVLGALLLVAAMDQSLHRSGDDLSRGRVHDLAAEVTAGDLPAVLPIGGEGVGQVFDSRGRVLAASPNVHGKPPITRPATTGTPRVRVIDGAPDDAGTEDYRVWLAAVPTGDGPVTVLAGSSIESVQEATRTLRRDLLVAVPLLVLLVAAGTWLVVGRTLRPVEQIRAEVAAIGDDDRSGRRVPVPGTDDEVSRLATTMNEMLDRLETAQRRQRSFVADASHELQSPITALRTQLEVALQHPGEDWRALAARLLDDTDQMERLVRDLLFLARTTDGAAQPTSTLVDLDDLVLEEVARVRIGTRVEVDASAVSAAPVRGNADELRRLVRNLLENAVRHARSRVVVTLEGGATTVRLDVRDDGPGVSDEHREHVFDRFWTADESRSGGSGSGLGLSIARAVAVRHGGSLDLAARNGAGAHFVVRVPTAGV